ncbi:MAG: alpha/beta fold hydrolase [Gallionella sp.]
MSTQYKVNFSGTSGQLEGAVHLPDESPLAIAVIAHPLPIMGGTMENKVVTTLAKTFVDLGYATLRFNFRGVGASDGSYDEGRGETLDAIAAAEFMREQFPDLALLIGGFSFGGYVQARAAEELLPEQLVLIAPAVGRFDMPQVSRNALVVHGDQDEVVELLEVLDWARPQHLPVIVLTGAGHFFHGRLTQLRQVITRHMSAPP